MAKVQYEGPEGALRAPAAKPAARIVALALILLAQPARGDETNKSPDADATRSHHVRPPPAPGDHEPTLSISTDAGMVAPLERGTICPGGADCVLGPGIALGVHVERRGADGLGLIAGYDFFLVDGDGVFELGALQVLRGGVRYVIDDAWRVHPFVDATFGVLAFGDTTRIATMGGMLTAGGGAEFELSESVAFVTALQAWFLATGPFVTVDGVTRSADFGVNAVLQIAIGVSIQVGPTVAPP